MVMSLEVEPGQAPVTTSDSDNNLDALVTLASALLDPERVRIAGLLVAGPANRMQMAQATGLSHRELLRQLDVLQQHGLVRLAAPVPRQPDHYSPCELNDEAFRQARQAMGKYKGVKPRPTDSRELTLETFMPGGKLTAFPRKQEQLLVVLDVVAQKFEPEKQYTEQDVNVILEEVNEDYCTIRRHLIDFGYMSRSNGIYTKNV